MWKTASVLIAIVSILVTLGIVMLASTSGVRGETVFKDSTYFVKRQAVWLALSALVAAAAAGMDYRRWRTLAVPLFLLSVVLLAVVLVPGIGHRIKGSSRWLKCGPMNFQPSELAKFCVVVALAWWVARVQRHMGELKRGVVIPLAVLAVVLGLVFFEPDFGTAVLIAAVGFSVLFVGGARAGYLLVAAAAGLVAFILAVMQDAERAGRVLVFLDPWKYEKGEGWQVVNALYAFVVGGGQGVGLGQGMQKHHYLPEAHTDFIFAIVGEELGLAASLLVVVLFLGLFLCGLRISFGAPDLFGRILGFGLTFMITLQAAINIGVVTGCLPPRASPCRSSVLADPA